MIHPHTELRFVNAHVGYGIFATQLLPKGTVIYTEDPLDRVISPQECNALPAVFQPIVQRLAYVDMQGNYVLCWDIAKHMNHCCECNTLSTAYGIDIALQDIHPGEELTDDYGLFNLEGELALSCGCSQCRLVLRPDDFEHLHPEWDRKIQEALPYIVRVSQPLLNYIDPHQWADCQDYLQGRQPYRSVQAMRYTRM